MKPLAIDAFCGAGGLSLGLSKAGFSVCLAYDNDQKAVETYRLNLGPHVICENAYNIDISEELKKRGVEPKEIVLFAGGPPCQGFSSQRRGEDNDPRNQLLKVFFDQALSVKPNFILFENVLGVRGERGRKLIEFVKQECSDDGYAFHIKMLNAADYGVAQIRKRFFILAERLDGGLSSFSFPPPIYGPDRYRTVRDAIGDLPSPTTDGKILPNIPNHRADKLSELNRRRFECVPQSGGRADIPEELRLNCHRVSVDVSGHRYVYGRLNWEKPAGVITARFDSLTRGKFGHPVETRTISLREGARLQSFPDDYVFIGNKVQVARQIGNAVPPVLATQIGNSILDAWKSRYTGSPDKV